MSETIFAGSVSTVSFGLVRCHLLPAADIIMLDESMHESKTLTFEKITAAAIRNVKRATTMIRWRIAFKRDGNVGDIRRLRAAAKHYKPRDVVLAEWIKASDQKFYRLGKKA